MSGINEKKIRDAFCEITKKLIEKDKTVTTMESCTSGLIASLITDTEGASAVLKGAFVTYSNIGKIMQGVPKETIEKAFFEYPDFAKAYVILLSEKIHFLNKKLSAFSEGEAAEKLLRWIKNFSNGENEFFLPCSVSKLAGMLGIGRASVYRAFDTLSERDIIRKDGKKIVILKP